MTMQFLAHSYIIRRHISEESYELLLEFRDL